MKYCIKNSSTESSINMPNDLLPKSVGKAEGGKKGFQLVLQLHLVSSLKQPENKTPQLLFYQRKAVQSMIG